METSSSKPLDTNNLVAYQAAEIKYRVLIKEWETSKER